MKAGGTMSCAISSGGVSGENELKGMYVKLTPTGDYVKYQARMS